MIKMTKITFKDDGKTAKYFSMMSNFTQSCVDFLMVVFLTESVPMDEEVASPAFWQQPQRGRIKEQQE